jgi:hypothetical protein
MVGPVVPMQFLRHPGVVTAFGARPFSLYSAQDRTGRRLMWSPQLDVSGELTDMRTYPGGVVVAAGSSARQAHPSELAVTPVREVRFRPP